MPIQQRVFKHGNSRVMVIPSGWLKSLEREGLEVTEVQLEINGEIIVRPVLTSQEEPKEVKEP